MKEMVATILAEENKTTIKNAIHQELVRALHDESLSELDIQSSKVKSPSLLANK
jgi:hypothetical protein